MWNIFKFNNKVNFVVNFEHISHLVLVSIVNFEHVNAGWEGYNICFKFGKDTPFRQLYDVLKRHKEKIFNKKIPQCSCLCEICENGIFLINGLNKKLYPETRLPATKNELIARFSCEDFEKYMFGKCEKCSSQTLSRGEFNVNLIADSDSVD